MIFNAGDRENIKSKMRNETSSIYTAWRIDTHHSTVQYSTVQYSTVQYGTVQYGTVQYNTVQYNTVQYSTVQYSTVRIIIERKCRGIVG